MGTFAPPVRFLPVRLPATWPSRTSVLTSLRVALPPTWSTFSDPSTSFAVRLPPMRDPCSRLVALATKLPRTFCRSARPTFFRTALPKMVPSTDSDASPLACTPPYTSVKLASPTSPSLRLPRTCCASRLAIPLADRLPFASPTCTGTAAGMDTSAVTRAVTLGPPSACSTCRSPSCPAGSLISTSASSHAVIEALPSILASVRL